MASFGELCEPCQTQKKHSIAASWCPECEEKLCSNCVTHHKSSKATRNHHLVDIEMMSEIPSELTTQQICTTHKQLHVEYFCSEHDDVCCRACLAENHKSCGTVVALDLVCQNVDKASLLEDSEIEIENIISTLSAVVVEMKTKTLSLNNDSKNIERSIAEFKVRAIERLNEYENVLVTALKSKMSRAKKKINQLECDAQAISKNATTKSKQITFVKEHGTNKQAFILEHNLKSFLTTTGETLSHITSNAKVTSVDFNENEDLLSSIPCLGSLTESETPCRIVYKPIKQRYAQCVTPMVDRLINSFKIVSRFKTSDEPNILGMIATEDNKLLLCNYTGKHNVLVYREDGQYLNSVSMKHYPFDIARIPSTEQYVVTLSNIGSIQYIRGRDLEPGNTVKLPVDTNVHGIATNSDNIFVGEYKQILVLNVEGTLVKKISVTRCSYIEYILLQKNQIYATDTYGSIVKIDDGTIDHQTNIPKTIGIPRKLCVDRQEYIYFGGQKSGRVHRLNKDLELDIVIGEDDFKEVTAICFNKDCSKLFVAVDRGKIIAIYSCK